MNRRLGYPIVGKLAVWVVTLALVLALTALPAPYGDAQEPGTSAEPPPGSEPEIPVYNEPFEGEGPHNPPIWRTFSRLC